MKLMKRDKGDTVSNMSIIVVTTLVIAIIMIAFTNWMVSVNKKFEINQIERKYALKMEPTGYLTTQQYNDLKDELKNSGMEVEYVKTYGHNIDQTDINNVDIPINSPHPDLKYGATIYLECKGKLRLIDYNVGKTHEEENGATVTETDYSGYETGFFPIIKKAIEMPINDTKSTTLKN